MFYRFTGQPDARFPTLVQGKAYALVVLTDDGGHPYIRSPFPCPYASWPLFYANWKPLITGHDSGDDRFMAYLKFEAQALGVDPDPGNAADPEQCLSARVWAKINTLRERRP